MITYYFSQPIYTSYFAASLIELKYKLNKKWESNTNTSYGDYNDLSKNSYDILIKELFKYSKQIILKDHKIELTEIWANEYNEKDFQEQHIHPNCHFSFTIMCKIPEGSGCLKLYNPYENLGFNHSNISFKYFNFVKEPKQEENTIIVWPSYIKHMVTPGTNKTKRVTYSGNFNII